MCLVCQESCTYINDLVLPVVTCFHDVDSRVQYYACEALYNIVKVARGAVLPFFNDIFDGLSKAGLWLVWIIDGSSDLWRILEHTTVETV